jgi:hypothetical protein
VTPTHPLRSGLVLASVLPDALSEGVRVVHPKFGRGVFLDAASESPVCFDRVGLCAWSHQFLNDDDMAALSIDLHHWTGRARVCAVMAVGRRCPCGGLGVQRCIGCGALPDETLRCASQENAGCVFGCDKSCCSGTGHLRPPTPLHAFLPIAEGGRVESAEESVVLLACSVAGVLAGVGPVAALVEHCGGEHWREVIGSVPSGEGIENWYGHRSMSKGSREAMLLARCALREGGGLVVPWPE